VDLLKDLLIRDLSEEDKGKEVTLRAWIHQIRPLGRLVFIILRDCSGMIQAVVKGNPELLDFAKKLNLEDVVEIKGTIIPSKSKIAPIEVQVKSIKILNRSSPLPLDISGKVPAELGTRLRYRIVDLKRPENLAIFRIQAELMDSFRRFLRNRGFIEVSTPKIVAMSTEGGAELFEVKYFEYKTYLAQSPQIYKQLLVIAGFERVYEVGHAYRAEKHNTIRHLNEYISLDVEMGFIDDENDLINLEEELVKYMLGSVAENCSHELKLLNVDVPTVDRIPKFTFPEVIEILTEYYNMPEYRDQTDLDPRGEELICRYARENYDCEFAFVDLFPLEGRPFYTMPYDSKLGRSFDLLFRGLEVSTGGQRIHKYDLLVKRIKEKGLNPESFKYYLEAFKYGAPPHGGFAIGAERFTMKLLNLKNIREASLFPRDRYRVVP